MILPSRVRIYTYAAALVLLSMTGAADILSTSGFTECGNGPQDVTVSQFQMSFDRATKELDFAVAGESKVSQNVTGIASVVTSLTSSPGQRYSIRKSGVYTYLQPMRVLFPSVPEVTIVSISNSYVQYLLVPFMQKAILQSQTNMSNKSRLLRSQYLTYNLSSIILTPARWRSNAQSRQ
jgi:hypothetical protein